MWNCQLIGIRSQVCITLFHYIFFVCRWHVVNLLDCLLHRHYQCFRTKTISVLILAVNFMWLLRIIHSILHLFLVGRLMGSPWKAPKPNSILNWRLKPQKTQWLIVVLTMGLAWTGGLQKWLFTVSKPACTLFYQFRLKFLFIFDSVTALKVGQYGPFPFTLQWVAFLRQAWCYWVCRIVLSREWYIQRTPQASTFEY